MNSSQGAVWLGQVETDTVTGSGERERDEEDEEQGGVSGSSERQAPARRFQPHGPSQHQTL